MSKFKNAFSSVYPTPQKRRKNYYILSDGWKLNKKNISVPYPPQSKLSFFEGKTEKNLSYTLDFPLPENLKNLPKGSKIYLNFCAVDQTAEVSLNGEKIACHEGGYLPFKAEVTKLLKENNNLTVNARDALSHKYPYGKQRKKRGGMWYTPVSGIWGSVYLEVCGEDEIKSFAFTPDLSGVKVDIDCLKPCVIEVVLPSGKKLVKNKTKSCYIAVPDDEVRLWSPDSPYLYETKIKNDTDEVKTYFALRTFENKIVNGTPLFLLNGKPIFLSCVLDQGYFEGGIFLPENPDEWAKDILRMKSLGFNSLRKHIKIEPEIFYEACDRLGMLVLQDMVNSGSYKYFRQTVLPTIGLKFGLDKRIFATKRRKFFIEHTLETVKTLFNHPSVVGWTIFNEGWGQFNSDKIYSLVKAADPTRFIDSTSGWFARKKSDVKSEHVYFHNRPLKGNGKQVLFLSECGGYGRAVKGHLFAEKLYGYGKTAASAEELTDKFKLLIDEMIIPSLKNGLCGFVYTQLSDVEDEINGLYTYDRQVLKVDEKRVKCLIDKVNKLFNELHSNT